MWPIRPPHWVGRQQELAVLGAAMKALAGGEGTVVWVEGEPGIGKSSSRAGTSGGPGRISSAGGCRCG
jgi:hypothetical protein